MATSLRIAIPAAPILVAGVTQALWLTPDGEIEELTLGAAAECARSIAPLLIHAPATARRLNVERFPALDLLELFAFVRPARFCVPTPRGIAEALRLPLPGDLAAQAVTIGEAARTLLAELSDAPPEPERLGIARVMARGGWRWGPAVLAALGDAPGAFATETSHKALAVWSRLPEWSEHAPEAPAGHMPVEPVEARARLVKLLGPMAEARPQQADYASAASQAFVPRQLEDHPNLVLAEAGTGVGKTLGYLAPATVWAEKNQGVVWISTYTKNLQHQIDRELDRLFPEAIEKARQVVIRKGRENYLCLLNFEEAVTGLATRPHDAIALGLMARWAAASRDGDMQGGDFPAWLMDLVGRRRTRGLADQRGECIYSACPHFNKCFIEKSIRRAKRAEIVIANHALVMVQAARAALGIGTEESRAPTRYVFDEGHHVFDAADGAFSGLLSGVETHDLRRWLLGPEATRARGRARGLKSRAGELAAAVPEGEVVLEHILSAARALPGEGWLARLAGNQPVGPTEAFLTLVRRQVHARAATARGTEDGYSLETETAPIDPPLLEAAARLDGALERLQRPMRELGRLLLKRLDDEAADLDTATRTRSEAIARSLARRAEGDVAGWRRMLAAVKSGGPPPEYVDWFAVERYDGRDLDVGMHRHWIDPGVPFAGAVVRPAHGVLMTSATLTDATGDIEADWTAAEARTGARHLPQRRRASVPSPFDYAAQTRVIVVRDVKRDDPRAIAAAMRELFLAAGGGALGLFTAIGRLRAVRALMAPALEAKGLPLYAQHVDGLDTGTLIDIFRSDPDSCLLGTDAVRDGVDVPGRSLRLLVFDRVPWPRPDILHKARRAEFGAAAYDDMIARLRLKQAYGRLIRRADDTGVFVLLDSRLPSRLATAFPPGVEVRRTGLAEAIALTRDFLAPAASSA